MQRDLCRKPRIVDLAPGIRTSERAYYAIFFNCATSQFCSNFIGLMNPSVE